MSLSVAVLAVMAMLATTAATGIMLRVFWGTFGEAIWRAPARRIAVARCVLALFYAPGVVLLTIAPWGNATDRIVLTAYVGGVALYILAFSIVSAPRRDDNKSPALGAAALRSEAEPVAGTTVA